MKKSIFLSLICFVALLSIGFAQPNFTANDQVPSYDGPFEYGANMGFYAPWQDEQLANIAAGNHQLDIKGVGVTSLRPALFSHFLEQWGYDIRVNAFKHYASIGAKANTAFIGYPNPAQRDFSFYCPGRESEMFAGIYEPIWDGGANGTPVNDNNHYALYLYKMVSLYKDYVKIWEVWNEPDFDHSGNSLKPAGEPGSWWTEDPSPCDLATLTPVYHYNRLLRISYEVIKSIDPEAYVAIGGIGYPSFLDAVLRNTDNPDQGKISSEYPLKSGAYFDVLSFHVYPHIDGSLRKWNDNKMGFDYFRHSDAAAKGVVDRKKEFEVVLDKHAYDGSVFPKKEYIITECNIPRKTFGQYIGSEDAQRNFLMKALIACQQNEIRQFHVYQLGETNAINQSSNEFELMGLYENLPQTQPYNQKSNSSGVAYKTISSLLHGKTYDPLSTQEMLLPDNIGGAAFAHGQGDYTYVLWAKTRTDRSELATTQYTFPSLLNVSALVVKEWNFSETNDSLNITGSSIQLTGEPIFITVKKGSTPAPSNPSSEEAIFQIYPNPYIDSSNIIFKLKKEQKVKLAVFDLNGRLISEFLNGEILLPGIHRYVFDEDVRQGVYVCKLQIGKKKYAEKVIKVEGTD